MNWLTAEIQQYIKTNQEADPKGLALVLAKQHPDWPISDIISQIKGKKKAQNKLPEWVAQPQVLWPPSLSLEQSSSEITAKYKAALISGKLLADLTGGLGVDSYYFSKKFGQVYFVERQENLVDLAKHNHAVLAGKNIDYFCQDAADFLEKTTVQPDWIFVDPARRNEERRKVYKLEDCSPDLKTLVGLAPANQKWLFKLSPMLDIQMLLKDIPSISKVYVLAVQNECKELLAIVNGDPTDVEVVAVDLNEADATMVSYKMGASITLEYSPPLAYIYEPNAPILKAAAQDHMAQPFDLKKLHPHSHLYTSNLLINDFPGRSFAFVEQGSFQKKWLRKVCPQGKANITIRNYPSSVTDIRNKTKLKEGGEVYLFATTLVGEKHVVLQVSKIK